MQKIQASQLFDGTKIWENTPIVISNDHQIIDIVPIENAGENILKIDGLLCPAFVNAHCHLELSHLHQRIKQHTGMASFLQQVVSQKNNFEEQEIIAAAAIQDQKMYQSGIAVVGDIANQAYTISVKKKSSIIYHTFVEILGLLPHQTHQKYEEGRYLKNLFLQHHLQATLVPHSPYSLCLDLFKKIGNIENNNIVSMHYHESQDEIDWLTKHSGDLKKFYDFLNFSILPDSIIGRNQWATCFTNNTHFLAVHNVHASEEDIDFLNTYFWQHKIRLFLCLCPQANQYIQQQKPPYFLWQKYKEQLCIGTDSLASNKTLDILSELKLIQQDYPQIPLSYLLQAATYNGAKALNMDNHFGSIAIGKSAQLIVLKNIVDHHLQHAVVQRISTINNSE